MNIRRPGKNQPVKKSSGKFYITILLIIGVMILFWYNLKQFQGTENKKIESTKDYLPAPYKGIIYDKPYFSLSYREQYELPEWVAYRLTSDMINKPNHPRSQDFEPDQTITTGSAHYHDYKQSGYSKGHLVPAADMSWDQQAMNSTFLMSNVAPMLEQFNSGIWLELEHDVRDWATKYKNIIVIAGPIFRDSLGLIGANDVLVPRYFYKAVFTTNKGKPEAIGFIFDQTKKFISTLDQYVVPIDSIEKETGLDLFANMYGSWENEIRVERDVTKAKGEWPFNPYWYQERIEN
ncbi:MAG: DNA/RNA non-specific endonuclease [Saprospiraceae bacterium]|uniref:DNA/RNA non-specific endonuclease n=1 Tax=Candidatus Opimibacter skivensis TaxID=2982028 RepID=A0A9D7SXV2_9BACT|nr:DNA/RNA non-specific endonuclease [Candidatus Opimibacter skivensis]